MAASALLPTSAIAAEREPDSSPPQRAVERPSRAENVVSRPGRKAGATIATIVAPVKARGRPAGGRVVWKVPVATEWSGQPHQLLVLGARRDRHGRRWLRVQLPIRPNQTAAWIPARKVRLSSTDFWVKISTGSRTLSVYRAGKRVRGFRVVVGHPSTPTPHGLFAILEKNRQPNPRGFLGPWALSLTAFSQVLKNYGGGPGRVAIHGRDGPSLLDPLGSARSHGCIRIPDRYVSWMARRLPRGTPVRIVG